MKVLEELSSSIETPTTLTVAQGIGGTAVGLDVTDEDGIVDLVNQTVKDYGTLDVFVSNAGYVTQGGLEAENAEIQRIMEVHVMSHVYAARAAVPSWLQTEEDIC